MTDLIALARATVQQALEALEKTHTQPGCDQWQAERKASVALRAPLKQPNECRWLQDGDEDSGTYMASCNRRYFVLEDGTPTDNHMTHCCYCGKPLVEVPIEPENSHD
jgi:hypothetical protein